MKTLGIALLVLLAVTGCDVIEAPYIKNPTGSVDTLLKDTSTTMVRTGGVQNVLLEDYTGHTCGNCPEAADIATSIYEKNKPRVIVVAIHAGGFALPDMPDYPADYRTPVGDELDQTFMISRAGNPNGLINRVRYNNRFILSQSNWDPATTAQLSKSPAVDLGLSHTYHSQDSTFVVTVETAYRTPGESDYSLVVFLTENGIVGDQKDYRKNPSHIEEYEFEHVLRASFNGTWGDTLSTTAIPVGGVVKKTVRYRIPPGKNWNLANCEIVAFVIRRKDAATRDVLQVVKQKVVVTP